jgi:1-deoxy-D-xylulose-5-phosphate reductoisomerase
VPAARALLNGGLPFLGIPAVIEGTMGRLGSQPIRAFETLYEADREARSVAGELLSSRA